MSKSSSSGGGCGCISIILGCIALWAVLFGVTINGKHYGLVDCSTNKGVTIHTGE